MSTATRKIGRPMVDPGPDAILARRIRSRRLSLNMTQRDLATSAMLGTAGSSGARIISELERGRNLPSYRSIEGLCRALQWTPNDLFEWDERGPSS